MIYGNVVGGRLEACKQRLDRCILLRASARFVYLCLHIISVKLSRELTIILF